MIARAEARGSVGLECLNVLPERLTGRSFGDVAPSYYNH